MDARANAKKSKGDVQKQLKKLKELVTEGNNELGGTALYGTCLACSRAMPKPGPAWDPKLEKERANISGLGLQGERTGEVVLRGGFPFHERERSPEKSQRGRNPQSIPDARSMSPINKPGRYNRGWSNEQVEAGVPPPRGRKPGNTPPSREGGHASSLLPEFANANESHVISPVKEPGASSPVQLDQLQQASKPRTASEKLGELQRRADKLPSLDAPPKTPQALPQFSGWSARQ